MYRKLYFKLTDRQQMVRIVSFIAQPIQYSLNGLAAFDFPPRFYHLVLMDGFVNVFESLIFGSSFQSWKEHKNHKELSNVNMMGEVVPLVYFWMPKMHVWKQCAGALSCVAKATTLIFTLLTVYFLS